MVLQPVQGSLLMLLRCQGLCPCLLRHCSGHPQHLHTRLELNYSTEILARRPSMPCHDGRVGCAEPHSIKPSCIHRPLLHTWSEKILECMALEHLLQLLLLKAALRQLL